MRILICLLVLLPGHFSADFKTEQLKNERVKIAYSEKLTLLESLLRKQNLDINHLQLYLRAFKYEKVIEVWAKNGPDKAFKLFQEIPFCAYSGRLGPKVQQGDGQIPEGFYYINRFHPESKYFLSLGLNYPNVADSVRNKTANLGGNIFIHGKCASIGCLSITDNRIKELYLLAVEASKNGQAKIPVHIFPAKLTSENMEQLELLYSENQKKMNFWKSLKTGYDYFETSKTVPPVVVAKNGEYQIKEVAF